MGRKERKKERKKEGKKETDKLNYIHKDRQTYRQIKHTHTHTHTHTHIETQTYRKKSVSERKYRAIKCLARKKEGESERRKKG